MKTDPETQRILGESLAKLDLLLKSTHQFLREIAEGQQQILELLQSALHVEKNTPSVDAPSVYLVKLHRKHGLLNGEVRDQHTRELIRDGEIGGYGLDEAAQLVAWAYGDAITSEGPQIPVERLKAEARKVWHALDWQRAANSKAYGDYTRDGRVLARLSGILGAEFIDLERGNREKSEGERESRLASMSPAHRAAFLGVNPGASTIGARS